MRVSENRARVFYQIIWNKPVGKTCTKINKRKFRYLPALKKQAVLQGTPT